MTLEETTQLYASVLRQLLPTGGYDTSPNTEALAVDVYAHAKLLAQADLDAKRLLKVLEGFPPELISEYETEYGLPLKCSINAGKTLEERIELLKWVRSTRNVLNKAYLEQILAIFGVVLIDIVKFKPLLCIAPCNSPVNTEQLRYKVLLKLQYPVNADMGCIIENYLPAYLRFDLLVDMPFGDWVINSGVTINTSGVAYYTAYKTNQREYYDSYADFGLTNAIILSLSDSEMQRLQAISDAVSAVEPTAIDYSINASDLVFNIRKQPENVATDEIVNVILDRYVTSPQNFVGKDPFHTLMIQKGYAVSETGTIQKQPDLDSNDVLKYTSQYSYRPNSLSDTYSVAGAMAMAFDYAKSKLGYGGEIISYRQNGDWDGEWWGMYAVFYIKYTGNLNEEYGVLVQRTFNSFYDQNYVPVATQVTHDELKTALKTAIDSHATDIADVVSELIDSVFNYDDIAGSNALYESTLSIKSFNELSQQIIFNAQADNQTISPFAEAYLKNVAKSVFNTDESKQFVKITDIYSQFELNKTLRT
jgi:uncharacterized protein YmfQ (DUF2313 family)